MKTNFSFDMQALDEGIHSRFPNHKEAPLIGLTGNFSDGNLTLAPGYYQSIIQAGGVPVVIPPYEDVNLLINTLEQLDGLLLTGGGDLNPLFLHEDPIRELHSINPYRDRQELLLTRPTDSDVRYLPRDAGHQCGIGRHTLSGHLCTEGYPID